MSRNNLQFVNNILDRIKTYYSLKTDLDLANFLEIHRSTISAWRRRGALDFSLIFNKCSEPDLNWLIYGQTPASSPYPGNHMDYEHLREGSGLTHEQEHLKMLLQEYQKVTKIIRDLLSKLPE
jgi:hypothetical protein